MALLISSSSKFMKQFASHQAVIEGQRLFSNNLICFVSFACNQHRVSGVSRLKCVSYRITPVNDNPVTGVRHSGFDLPNDRGRVLSSGIVGSDDDVVSALRRGSAHQWTL